MRLVRHLLLALPYVLSLSPRVEAAEWPQWLGPQRDGTSPDTRLVDRWLRHGLEECWRRPVGEGFSGVVISGGVAYTLDARDGDEHVFAVSVAEGRELWRAPLGPSPRDNYGGHGPRVTPTLDGGHLLLVSAAGDLLALRATDGSTAWKVSLRALGARFPAEGYAASVLVDGERVVVPVGGKDGRSLAAFERSTGRLLWSSLSDRASYSSPISWTVHERAQILALTAHRLVSLDPTNGAQLWEYEWATYDGVNVATPIVVPPDRVFISAGYDQGAALLRVLSRDDSLRVAEVWRNRHMKNHFSNSVHHEGVLFGFDNAILTALEAATGKPLWQARGFGKGSLVLAAGHLVLLSERGELALAPASPHGLEVRRRLRVLTGKSWTPPSLASGRLFVRNHTEMVCLEPAGPVTPR